MYFMHFSLGCTMGKMDLHEATLNHRRTSTHVTLDTMWYIPPLVPAKVPDIMEAVICIYPLRPFLAHGGHIYFSHILWK